MYVSKYLCFSVVFNSVFDNKFFLVNERFLRTYQIFFFFRFFLIFQKIKVDQLTNFFIKFFIPSHILYFNIFIIYFDKKYINELISKIIKLREQIVRKGHFAYKKNCIFSHKKKYFH